MKCEYSTLFYGKNIACVLSGPELISPSPRIYFRETRMWSLTVLYNYSYSNNGMLVIARNCCMNARLQLLLLTDKTAPHGLLM